MLLLYAAVVCCCMLFSKQDKTADPEAALLGAGRDAVLKCGRSRVPLVLHIAADCTGAW